MKKVFFIFLLLTFFIMVALTACNISQLKYEENESQNSDDIVGGPTLPGALEIYPTVMVAGELYKWGKVYDWDTVTQTQGDLPEESVFYGELTHVEGDTPENNCEFVSTFQVSGQIYTLSNNPDEVLLCLTTDWMTNENTIIEFDIVK